MAMQQKKRSMILKSVIAVMALGTLSWIGLVGASPASESQGIANITGSFDVVPSGRIGTNIGDQAPNIVMNNPKGVIYT